MTMQYRTRSNYPNILIARMAYTIIPNSSNMLNCEFSYPFYLTPNSHTTQCTQILKYGRSSRRRLGIQLHCSCYRLPCLSQSVVTTSGQRLSAETVVPPVTIYRQGEWPNRAQLFTRGWPPSLLTRGNTPTAQPSSG